MLEAKEVVKEGQQYRPGPREMVAKSPPWSCGMALRVKGHGYNKQTEAQTGEPNLALTPRPHIAGLQYPCPGDTWGTQIISKSQGSREN